MTRVGKGGADKTASVKAAPDKTSPDKSKLALTELAELAGEWVLAVEAAAAGLVASEMAAFDAMIAPQVTLSPEAKAAKAVSDEEKAEDGFDNMPL